MSVQPAEFAVVERPNGKTYRARKAPVAQLLDDGDGFPTGVMVERTHDVAVARDLALAEMRTWDCEEWPMSEPQLVWVHQRPDGPERFMYESDAERGCPAVQFLLSEPRLDRPA